MSCLVGARWALRREWAWVETLFLLGESCFSSSAVGSAETCCSFMSSTDTLKELSPVLSPLHRATPPPAHLSPSSLLLLQDSKPTNTNKPPTRPLLKSTRLLQQASPSRPPVTHRKEPATLLPPLDSGTSSSRWACLLLRRASTFRSPRLAIRRSTRAYHPLLRPCSKQKGGGTGCVFEAETFPPCLDVIE